MPNTQSHLHAPTLATNCLPNKPASIARLIDRWSLSWNRCFFVLVFYMHGRVSLDASGWNPAPEIDAKWRNGSVRGPLPPPPLRGSSSGDVGHAGCGGCGWWLWAKCWDSCDRMLVECSRRWKLRREWGWEVGKSHGWLEWWRLGMLAFVLRMWKISLNCASIWHFSDDADFFSFSEYFGLMRKFATTARHVASVDITFPVRSHVTC